jgi:uncharacterized protein
MRWLQARAKHLPELVDALRQREWACVSLSERLIRNGVTGLPTRSRDRIFIGRGDAERVTSVLLHSRNGTVLPCLFEPGPCARSLEQQLGDRIRRSSVTMVMGTDDDVRAVENLIPSNPDHSVLYDLLVLDPRQRTAFSPQPWYEIRPAEPRDMEAVLPLQTRYEQEEVLLPGRRLNRLLVKRNLQLRLQNQKVYLAIVDGFPIAMAGTNARGFEYDQIGGVFTHEAFRNRGVSTALMHRLAADALQSDRKLCLFVKPTNHAALQLYLRMGFTMKDRFRISYFQR